MASALAAFIGNELARRNMTQVELEQLSGIPDSTLSRIMTGKIKEPKPSGWTFGM
jgi:transcriptional regulator with XRE-family HTH domain